MDSIYPKPNSIFCGACVFNFFVRFACLFVSCSAQVYSSCSTAEQFMRNPPEVATIGLPTPASSPETLSSLVPSHSSVLGLSADNHFYLPTYPTPEHECERHVVSADLLALSDVVEMLMSSPWHRQPFLAWPLDGRTRPQSAEHLVKQIQGLFGIYGKDEDSRLVGDFDPRQSLLQDAAGCLKAGLPISKELFVEFFHLVCSTQEPDSLRSVCVDVLIRFVHLFPQIFEDVDWLSEVLRDALATTSDSTALELVSFILGQHAKHRQDRFWLCPLKGLHRSLQLVVQRTAFSAADESDDNLETWCSLLGLAAETHSCGTLIRRVHVIASELRNFFGGLSMAGKVRLLRCLPGAIAFRLVRLLLESEMAMGEWQSERLDVSNRTSVEEAITLYASRLDAVPHCSAQEADEYVLYICTVMSLIRPIRPHCWIDADGLLQQLQRLCGASLSLETTQRLRFLKLWALS